MYKKENHQHSLLQEGDMTVKCIYWLHLFIDDVWWFCLQESDYFVKVGVVPDQNKAGATPVATN